jgi:hypothetical protein
MAAHPAPMPDDSGQQLTLPQPELDDYAPMTRSERFRKYLTSTFGPKAINKSATAAEIMHRRDITDGITVSDVRWLLPWLSGITQDDFSVGFLASGATASDADRFARSIRNRIAQLECLS